MTSEKRPYLFEFKKIGDSSIGFISITEKQDLPFNIDRVYWTYFTPNDVIRGNHAHKDLSQIIIAVSGQIVVETEDRYGEKKAFTLNKPNQGLFVPPFCWRTLQFSHSAVLLCLASSVFTEDDYFRSYDEFKKAIQK